MPLGNLLKKLKINTNTVLKVYFVAGSFIIIIIFMFYTHSLTKQAQRDAQVVPNLFARFVSYSTKADFNEQMLQYILEEIISKIDYPIIVTDEKYRPLYWRNIKIPETMMYTTLTLDQKQKLNDLLLEMRRHSHEIPIQYGVNSRILGFAYYSDSPSMIRLKYLPYVEVLLILLFISIGIYGLTILKRSEKNLLWVGLAKETAHQFGTPISSLLGWISILQSRIEIIDEKSDMLPMLNYMQTDVEQLTKVASRFGKVGSTIKLKPTLLIHVINETVDYIKTRLPNINHKIYIHVISKINNIEVNVDTDLIKWALENMIKNCIDAMQLKGGNIFISAFSNEKYITILLRDEGKGMPKSMFKKIFEPGITSKSRGWGLGLSLTKRIIQDYHKGKVRVLDSRIDEGTTFEIQLPREIK